MAHALTAGLAIAALLVPTTAAFAQQTDQRPAARPAPTARPTPPVVRPVPKPGGGFGGSNVGSGGNRPGSGGVGSNGGNRPGFGGSGSNGGSNGGNNGGSGGNRPGFGGSNGSWNGGNGGGTGTIRPPRPPRPDPRPPAVVIPPPPSNNWGGSHGGNWGGAGGNWQNGGIVRCESWSYRYAECRADTRGGVRLQRVLAGSCRQGHSWGTRRDRIWVNHGCRADFRVGRGGGNWGGGGGYPEPDRGPSAGAVIGGVAVAAGLIALLASSSKSQPPPASAGTAPPPPAPYPPNAGPARIAADLGGLTPDARPSFNNCLAEAARQIGATGGSEIGVERFDEVERGNGGWRIRARLRATYPDETRSVPVYCRATPTEVIELTFG